MPLHQIPAMLPLIDSPALTPLPRGILNAATFLFSLVLLEGSADVFVDSTATVARRYSIPPMLIGMLTAGAEWEEVRHLESPASCSSVLTPDATARRRRLLADLAQPFARRLQHLRLLHRQHPQLVLHRPPLRPGLAPRRRTALRPHLQHGPARAERMHRAPRHSGDFGPAWWEAE